ncbi:Glutathione S-transferase domain [Methylobacterium sp. 4-46]|uniref:glutathione S-transferase family protein n=1 Tax=unclassified Methylobacterium TaxID=2615210 RepID=UPI000152E13F|nr:MULTISPECIES: glutathione S-transferase N-terminal domain-containing protein [Methylobacterium]ACA18150.1 Glutathione S-transferase domain [Methylobacterium sp. 4-46]WFT77448.1 glutathione S-transferase N-terminal domain-containing protein [Methylobacterium nodulans]
MTETLRLYYSPGACSLAPHVALEETGAPFEPVRVNLAAGEQRQASYLAINQKGRVPALAEGAWVLTENPAVLRYIARRFPEAGLWPEDPRGEAACAEWLAWLASTVHVAYAHVRRAERYAGEEAAIAEVQARGREACFDLWTMIEVGLSRGGWALGERYSVADPYLLVFWIWGRGPALGYEMARLFPHWTAHARRMAARPAVQRVFAREGLALPA